MTYFERLRDRARRASCREREALWQRYMERITRADLRFGTCGALCLVYAGRKPIAMGLTTSVSGWELCAAKVRHGLKTKTLTTAPAGREHPVIKAMPRSRRGRPAAAVALSLPG